MLHMRHEFVRTFDRPGPASAAVVVDVLPAGNVLLSSILVRSPANSVKMASTFLRTESWASSGMGVVSQNVSST